MNLGLNLSNDHPVSVAYAADRAGLRPTNTTISTIAVDAELGSSAATWDNGNLTANLWAVKGYVSDTATIADLLRDSKVECSSCHDPHFNNKSWNEIDATYTRYRGRKKSPTACSLEGSAATPVLVSATCHEK